MPVDLKTLRGLAPAGGSPVLALPPTWMAALGMIPGADLVFKYGYNTGVGPQGGAPAAVYPSSVAGSRTYEFFPDSAIGVEIVSSDARDTFGQPGGPDGGAQVVTVQGQDNDFNEIEEDVQLNGTTPVALTLPFRRIYRAFTKVGSQIAPGQDQFWFNRGNILIRGAGGGTVGAVILANFGQTTQTNYTVPAGKTALFVTASAQCLENDDSQVAIAASRPGQPSRTGWFGNASRDVTHLDNGVACWALPEKTDIQMVCFPADNNVQITGWYTLLLMKEQEAA